MSDVAGEQIKGFIERIETLEAEKQGLIVDIGDIYKEAKSNGYDTTILRTIIKLRKKAPEERQEEEALLELYMQALEMN